MKINNSLNVSSPQMKSNRVYCDWHEKSLQNSPFGRTERLDCQMKSQKPKTLTCVQRNSKSKTKKN